LRPGFGRQTLALSRKSEGLPRIACQVAIPVADLPPISRSRR